MVETREKVKLVTEEVLEVQKLLHPERFVDSDFVGQGEFDDSVVVGPYTNLLQMCHRFGFAISQDLVMITGPDYLPEIPLVRGPRQAVIDALEAAIREVFGAEAVNASMQF